MLVHPLLLCVFFCFFWKCNVMWKVCVCVAWQSVRKPRLRRSEALMARLRYDGGTDWVRQSWLCSGRRTLAAPFKTPFLFSIFETTLSRDRGSQTLQCSWSDDVCFQSVLVDCWHGSSPPQCSTLWTCLGLCRWRRPVSAAWLPSSRSSWTAAICTTIPSSCCSSCTPVSHAPLPGKPHHQIKTRLNIGSIFFDLSWSGKCVLSYKTLINWVVGLFGSFMNTGQ